MSYEITVDPKIEMLGILEYFADPKIPVLLADKIVDPHDQDYVHRIISKFAPLKDHKAIHQLIKMKEQNFKTNQAVRLLLYHSQIPYLFSQPVIQNQKHLEWIGMLREWIENTGFPTFLEKNQLYYKELVEFAENQLEQVPLCDIIELFFGEKRTSYHIYLSAIHTGNYDVFLPNKGIGALIGAPILKASDLPKRILKEFAYSFIRPAVDLHWSLFQSVKENANLSREKVYDLLAKAIQAVLLGEQDLDISEISWLYLPIMNEYQKNRRLYPNFSSFIPSIASQNWSY